MSDLLREFLVQGSDPNPYKVVFRRTENEVKANCNCRAGVNGLLCKHRLAILDGDGRAVVSGNLSEVEEVASWVADSPVAQAISEVVALEAQKKDLEEKIKNAKKQVAKALGF